MDDEQRSEPERLWEGEGQGCSVGWFLNSGYLLSGEGWRGNRDEALAVYLIVLRLLRMRAPMWRLGEGELEPVWEALDLVEVAFGDCTSVPAPDWVLEKIRRLSEQEGGHNATQD